MPEFKPVIIESPFAGDLERNARYLSECILDCIENDESPYASHRMFTAALDDTNPAQRANGMHVGEYGISLRCMS